MKEEKNKQGPIYLYSEKEFDKVSDYIEQQYGESEFVMHEVVLLGHTY